MTMICHNCIQINEDDDKLREYDLYSETKWTVKVCHHLNLLHGPGLWGRKRTKKEGYKCGDSAITETVYFVTSKRCVSVSLCDYRRKNEKYIGVRVSLFHTAETGDEHSFRQLAGHKFKTVL